MKGVSVGRIVHYVRVADGRHFAGIISGVKRAELGVVSLTVFTDEFYEKLIHVEPVYYDAETAEGTWHWPERDEE